MRRALFLLSAVAGLSIATNAPAAPGSALRCWLPRHRPTQVALEAQLDRTVDTEQLRTYHDLLCTEPHPAGTDADQRMIRRLAGAFGEMGLDVQVHEIQPYLPLFIDAQVQVLTDDGPIDLALKEDALDTDPYSSHPALTPGWNAYSSSGDITAPVVYANRATRADFEQLAELGVDCTGKIIIARYGGNYRGYKAKFAQEAGAVGLIIYTDPKDSGYRRGIPYPEGGYAHESSIQRGSIKTQDYVGDPLTPFVEATVDAERLDAQTVDLPRIPVQPMGWRSAQEILSRMRGPFAPSAWQGGLPLAYRVTGGDLRVRLRVEQQRRLTPTANVIGILEGAIWPNEKIIVGCHFDAWTFGAGDPHAGSIVLLEAARCFAEAARAGLRPARTIVFANWGAEEMGIIGSTEYCEANREDLTRNGVAYINLDMAAMGPRFGASASPLLKELIMDVAGDVAQIGDFEDEDRPSVYEAWTGERPEPRIGNLGGGSDHVGFYCHLGVPACALGAGGSRGVSYHSAYDNLRWYRQVVGDDYEPAAMVTRVVNLLLARLAGADLIPYDPTRYAGDIREHLNALEERAAKLGVTLDVSQLRAQLVVCEEQAVTSLLLLREAVDAGSISPETLTAVNTLMRSLEKSFVDPHGLPGRPWFRNLYAATDPDSGYSAWMLPGIRQAIEDGSNALAAASIGPYRDALDSLLSKLVLLENVHRRLDDMRHTGLETRGE